MNAPVNKATIDRIIKINDVITKHLSEEDDCHCTLKSIIQEAFLDDIDKETGWIASQADPTGTNASNTCSRPQEFRNS